MEALLCLMYDSKTSTNLEMYSLIQRLPVKKNCRHFLNIFFNFLRKQILIFNANYFQRRIRKKKHHPFIFC